MNPVDQSSLPRATLDALIDLVPQARGDRILLIGEPGIGKSTLMDAAASRFVAAGMIVLRSSPSFAERHTAYSMLWDLLSELDLESIVGLPGEYRTILDIALGRQSTTAELPALATAVALESILVELAARAPVVLIIDDLHWSDPESQATVERAVRRVVGAPVSLVATSREYGTRSTNAPDFSFDSGEIHVLEGLTVDELELLTRPRWPSTLTRAQVVALHEHTGGNPMWALELIGRGVIGDLGALPVGTLRAPLLLTAAVADRLGALSVDAADVVSIVALLGRPDLSLLTAVLRFSQIAAVAIDEAETAGFLVLTTRTARTRHPLHASAATARLGPARRRELHAFIARAVTDPVLRAQHLQQSQPPGPDEAIARALAGAAVAMRQRGARLRSAHFDAQAVERTDPTASQYQDRLLNQSQQLFSAGDRAACLRSLGRVSVQRLDDHQYDAYLALTTSTLAFGANRRAAHDFLAAQAESTPRATARAAMITANMVSSGTMTVTERAEASGTVLIDLSSVDAPNAVHRALRGIVRARLEAGEGLDRARTDDMVRRQSIQIVVGLDDTGQATVGYLAHLVDDVRAARHAVEGLVLWARNEGKEGVERAFLWQAALVEIMAGNITAARAFAEESGYSLASPTLPAAFQTAAGLLLISAGRYDELAALVEMHTGDTDQELDRHLELTALLGLSALAQSKWHEAALHFREAARIADSLELVELGARYRIDIPLVEALIHSGETEEAEMRLGQLREFLAVRDRPISQIGLYRVTSLQRAAQGDLEGALAAADIAVELSAAREGPADQARALLQRARVLHRLRRVTLARADLAAARDRAHDSGVDELCARVDTALSTSRQTRSPLELTRAESAVLARVRDGHSNKEIAAALFVGVRTVESHVSAILRKTGAKSRSKLISHG